jgi:hypothetical protein
MHNDFEVDILPNLYMYNPGAFCILATGILLPPSFTVVASENHVMLPVHCRSFWDD